MASKSENSYSLQSGLKSPSVAGRRQFHISRPEHFQPHIGRFTAASVLGDSSDTKDSYDYDLTPRKHKVAGSCVEGPTYVKKAKRTITFTHKHPDVDENHSYFPEPLPPPPEADDNVVKWANMYSPSTRDAIIKAYEKMSATRDMGNMPPPMRPPTPRPSGFNMPTGPPSDSHKSDYGAYGSKINFTGGKSRSGLD